MGSLFGGGGGGGSPPVAPKLRQVDTSIGGPLWKAATQTGNEWANLMRGSYGLQPSTAGAPVTPWMAPLGKGALSMMGQAAGQEAGLPDPQVTGTLAKAGMGGGPLTMKMSPFQMSEELGQQFKDPLTELKRNQGFTGNLASTWKPPNLTLTGEDLLNVKMGQMTQNAAAQQAAFAAALQGSNYAASAASQAQGAETAAFGKLAGAGINQITNSFAPSSYAQPSLGSVAGAAGTNAGAMDLYNPSFDYGGGSSGTSMFGS